ncbi:hypothetical protein [Limnothrix sp. PR1529]|uniref:hypothetical protein n=1 Tax=Limnothrix sp. PR1529 TaxID=1704291 RepID=UPI001179DE19|nr:hypothetical protein [Limnothrix sp. PR1529]
MVQGVAQINGFPSFLGCHTLGDRLEFVADLTICASDGVSQIRQLVLSMGAAVQAAIDNHAAIATGIAGSRRLGEARSCLDWAGRKCC